MEWKKIEEVGYPKDGSRVVVWDNYYKQMNIHVYNDYHKCWDDEEGDDYFCDLDTERIPAYIEIERYNG